MLAAEYHTETSAVKIIHLRFSVRLVVQLIHKVCYILQQLCGVIIADGGLKCRKAVYIQHNDSKLLVYLKGALDIVRIGDFVLDEVCRFIASDEFKELGVDYIEINLSVEQCMHSNLADKVLKTLEKYHLPPDKINLEITETAVSRGQNVMQANLDALSSAGISFSLDDYGTGYSNMRRVIQLPLKIVKLDKSFVDEQNNPKMWIVLQNTVKMLKDMNMEIVVEGIETQTMAEQFAALNCDFIQGYYYSRPIPQHEFVEFIKEAHKSA